MKVFALYKFTSSEKMNVYHYKFFHGLLGRDSVVPPSSASRKYHEDTSEPVYWTRNAYCTPHISWPATTLVVSEEVKERLSKYPKIKLLDVKVRKLFLFPYKAGDFGFMKDAAFRLRNPHDIFRKFKNEPGLQREMGNYFEVVIPIHDRLVRDVQKQLVDVKFRVRYLASDVDADIPLYDGIFDEYPMLWTGSGPTGMILMIEQVYKDIQPFIDLDYFSVATAKV